MDGRTFTFNGAIAPTLDGTRAAIDFNVTSGGEHGLLVQVRARSRGEDSAGRDDRRSDAEAKRCRRSRLHLLQRDGSVPVGVCRWGDYAGASTDPNSASQIFGSNQYLGTPPKTNDCPIGRTPRPCPYWRTENFALGPVP